jgi:xanthine dehydrogenase YagR molybdenum-binding subunit
VTFLLGDSRFPAAMAAVASGTVQSVGTSVVRAATQARDRAIAIAVAERRSPLHGLPPDRIGAADGYLFSTADPSRRISYETLMRYHGRAEVFVSAPEPPPNGYTTGAVFVEVRIDPSIGRLRVTKVVGVFDPGRVLNHQTARSQAVGGAIWGIGFALTEHTLVDPHLGRIMNPNLSGYLVPVNADVPDMKFEFIDLPDPTMPNLGARGLGEATSTGVAPAIGNAVHHATGRRIRELPITPEKLVSSHRT